MPHDDRTKAAVAAYVQERLQRETEEERGVAAEISRKTGFSSAHISNAKNWGSIGHDFAKAIAKYWGMSHTDLEAVALERFRGGDPRPALRLVEREDRYPSRSSAAELVRDRFRVSEQAIAEILDEQNQFPTDPGEGYWVEQFIARQRVLDRLGEGELPGRALPATLDGNDDE